MYEANYTTEILISAKPESVYSALTKEVDQWWSELSNQALLVGDQLVVRFENKTCWVMTVAEAIPTQSLVWKVIEANHDLDALTTSDEWQGTSIRWTLEGNASGCRLAFTHQGLVPALECYETCAAGWGYFLASLKTYLETGKGNPYHPT